MKIAPLDVRRARFGSALRGFNRAEVTSFLNETADDYEEANRESDRRRQEVGALQKQLEEHRQREASLRDTLLTAQRVSTEVRESAKQEAQLLLREARGRADELIRKARTRYQDVEREITELRLKRTDVETSIEGSIAALRHALDFVRHQDRDRVQDDKIRQHRPRSLGKGVGPVKATPRSVIGAVESQPS